jgi:ankyrin repeat protein
MAGALKHLMKDDGPSTAALIPTVMNILYGRISALENALDTGLDPNVVVWMGQEGGNTSLLCFAVDAGQRGSIRVLVEDGAYVNPSQFGQPSAPFCSPLAEAAIGAENDVLKYLLSNGANIEQETPRGATALAEAVKFGNYSTVMLLLKHGAKISSALGPRNVVSKQLVESTDPRYVAIRKLLVQHGAKMPPAH